MTATTTSPNLSPIVPSAQSPTLSEPTALTPASSASPNPSLPSTADGGGNMNSGLSQNDRIGLGVGLSVPIAAIVVAVLIWQCPKKTGEEPQETVKGLDDTQFERDY